LVEKSYLSVACGKNNWKTGQEKRGVANWPTENYGPLRRGHRSVLRKNPKKKTVRKIGLELVTVLFFVYAMLCFILIKVLYYKMV